MTPTVVSATLENLDVARHTDISTVPPLAADSHPKKSRCLHAPKPQATTQRNRRYAIYASFDAVRAIPELLKMYNEAPMAPDFFDYRGLEGVTEGGGSDRCFLA